MCIKTKLASVSHGLFALSVFFCVPPVYAETLVPADDGVVNLNIPSIEKGNQLLFTQETAHGKPEFYIKDLSDKVFPVESLNNLEQGSTAYQLRIPSQAPAGNYVLYGKVQGEPDVALNYNVRLSSPEIQSVSYKYDDVKNSAILEITAYHVHQYDAVSYIFKSKLEDKYSDYISCNDVKEVKNNHFTTQCQISKRQQKTINKDPAAIVVMIHRNDGPIGGFQLQRQPSKPTQGQILSFSYEGRVKKDQTKDNLLNIMYGGVGFWDKVARTVLDTFLSDIAMPKIIKGLNYGYQVMNIKYYTKDASNNVVIASGVVILPERREGNQAYSIIIYQHGTMLTKDEAPTISNGPELGFAESFAAASGNVVLVPDHLGLGIGGKMPNQQKMIHPFCQWESNARANADMITAVRSISKDSWWLPMSAWPDLNNNNPVFLTGYSEGGYLTMALHRELEAHPELYGFAEKSNPVLSSAPGDGPYSIAGDMTDKLLKKNEAYPEPFFAPYLLVSYNNTYPMGDASNFFNEGYRFMPSLINGNHTSKQVSCAMSKVIRNTLDETLIQQLEEKNIDGNVYSKLLLNDLADPRNNYTIKAPVMLVHGITDDMVSYSNSEKMLKYLTDHNNIGSFFLNQIQLNPREPVKSWLTNLGAYLHILYAPFAVEESWKWYVTDVQAACLMDKFEALAEQGNSNFKMYKPRGGIVRFRALENEKMMPFKDYPTDDASINTRLKIVGNKVIMDTVKNEQVLESKEVYNYKKGLTEHNCKVAAH